MSTKAEMIQTLHPEAGKTNKRIAPSQSDIRSRLKTGKKATKASLPS